MDKVQVKLDWEKPQSHGGVWGSPHDVLVASGKKDDPKGGK